MDQPPRLVPIDLWSEATPGLAAGDRPPHLEPYLLSGARGGSRAAIVVLPGGGYGGRAPHEGEPIARWLNSLGIASFVLHYRVAPYRHPYPLLDAQRAVRLVRHKAGEWGIDPHRIGVLGFSAGGHLAATLSTHFDAGDPNATDPVERQSCRPDLAILCYPVITFAAPYTHQGSVNNLLGPEPDPDLVQSLSLETRVTAETPPVFLWHTADDAAVPVENSLLFASALSRHKVPFALHIFPHGRHGLGLAEGDPEVGQWTNECAAWLAGRGFITDAPDPSTR